MDKILVVQSVAPGTGVHLKELYELRALINEMGIHRFKAHVVRYSMADTLVFTLAIQATSGDVYYMRTKHHQQIRLFKTEEAVSRAITILGFQTKTTYFLDAPLSRK